MIINSRKYGSIEVLIDKEIEAKLEGRWSLNPTGNCFYVHRNLLDRQVGRKHKVYLHRLVLEMLGHRTDGLVVDHINGNTLDNRAVNLRAISHADNLRNRRNAQGVYFDKRYGKWYAKTKVNGKTMSLGYFIDKEEASRVYREAVNNSIKEFLRG